ncbi:MAG TPA: hypothetical protein ENN65_08990 [Candidatus Hydrogenedentes bacterium]|nr:hypothetical protein [Candidatus Hydrogenedentota bacterium]
MSDTVGLDPTLAGTALSSSATDSQICAQEKKKAARCRFYIGEKVDAASCRVFYVRIGEGKSDGNHGGFRFAAPTLQLQPAIYKIQGKVQDV